MPTILTASPEKSKKMDLQPEIANIWLPGRRLREQRVLFSGRAGIPSALAAAPFFSEKEVLALSYLNLVFKRYCFRLKMRCSMFMG
jgi:hypothetical protein